MRSQLSKKHEGRKQRGARGKHRAVYLKKGRGQNHCHGRCWLGGETPSFPAVEEGLLRGFCQVALVLFWFSFRSVDDEVTILVRNHLRLLKLEHSSSLRLMPNQNYAKMPEGFTAWLAAEQPGGGNSWKLGKGSLSPMCAEQTIVGHSLLFLPLHFIFWDRLSRSPSWPWTPDLSVFTSQGWRSCDTKLLLTYVCLFRVCTCELELMSGVFFNISPQYSLRQAPSLNLTDCAGLAGQQVPGPSSLPALGLYVCNVWAYSKVSSGGLHRSECLHGKHFPQGDNSFSWPLYSFLLFGHKWITFFSNDVVYLGLSGYILSMVMQI